MTGVFRHPAWRPAARAPFLAPTGRRPHVTGQVDTPNPRLRATSAARLRVQSAPTLVAAP